MDRTAGVAGLVAGATAMAAGEYVSVSSQRDTEQADLASSGASCRDTGARARRACWIWRARGLSGELAERVADELSAGDRLVAHARDELGIDPGNLAQPTQAAWTSALSFSIGAAVPLITIAFSPAGARIGVAIAVTLIALCALGIAGARIGGAPIRRAALRVVIGGAVAMGVTMGIGALVGTAV